MTLGIVLVVGDYDVLLAETSGLSLAPTRCGFEIKSRKGIHLGCHSQGQSSCMTFHLMHTYYCWFHGTRRRRIRARFCRHSTAQRPQTENTNISMRDYPFNFIPFVLSSCHLCAVPDIEKIIL